MDQHGTELVEHKCLSCLSLSLTYILNLNRLSIIRSMTVCWMLDQPSFRCRLKSIHQHLAKSFNSLAPIALLRFCNLSLEC